MECDFDCQKNKQLDLLQGALYTATLKKGTDPEAYEQARTAYYTLKEGEGWLHQEKERKAVEEVDPIIDQYKDRIRAFELAQASSNARQQALKDVESNQVGDEDEVRFIHNQITKERNSAGVRKRLIELNGGSDWWSLLLNIILCFAILVTVYFAYSYYLSTRSISVG